MGGETLTLASFAASLSRDDVPDDVMHEAKRALIDWLGVALGGADDPGADLLCSMSGRLGGVPEATILGRDIKTGMLWAALTNGYMSHVLDYDDTYNPQRTTVHGSAPVWPALLALAEQRSVSGGDALMAFVAGFESEVRVARAAGPSHYEAGWHVTSTVGRFGAAAAAGRALDLSGERLAHAFGLAATQAGGLKGVYGSMGKAFHPGKAAMDGLIAALLAAEGFDATTEILETKRGFLAVLSPEPDPAQVTDRLGSTWTLPDNGYKPYACGSLMHPTIEGVITLLDESGATAADVEHIEATVNDYVSWVTGKREPATGLEAKFSIYHAAAVAALDGAAGPKQFTDERARADDVVALRDRIGVAVDETLPKVAARVTIELVDGTTLEKTVPANKGTPQRPMSDSDIEAKFVALAEDVIGGSRAKEVVARCWDLEQEADFAEIAQLCASSPA